MIQVFKHNTFNIERFNKIVVIHVHSCSRSLLRKVTIFDVRFPICSYILAIPVLVFVLIYPCKGFVNCSSIAN